MISGSRHSFRLAIISLLGVTTALTLSGFLVWRLLRGEWAEAALDSVVIVGILSITGLAWRSERIDVAGTLMVVFNTTACIVATWMIGPGVGGWVYVALMTNFYIAGTRTAAWCGLVLVVAATATLALGEGGYHLSTPVTWALVYAFSYAFSRRVRKHNDSLELRANQDPLTGMANRGALEARLQAIVAGRERGRVGLLILDIDRFKAINDDFGHAAGDTVLIALSAALHEERRQGDSVYRFGGEEFVLVLPAGTDTALETVAERLRTAVSERVKSPAGPITVSIGGAMYCGERDWQDWFARADASLYLAKRAGRDRVHIAESLPQ